MSVLQAEVYEAFRSIDVSDDKPLKAAVGLTARGFNKRDADIDATRKDVQSLKVDMAVIKWMVGFVLAMNVAVLFKLFAH